MARNKALKRQKQVQRRNAKRKAKRKALARQKAHDGMLRWQRAAQAPIRDCLVSEDLWENGIGSVLIGRETGPNELATAVFLLDVFCLGVKDAFVRFGTEAQHRQLIESLSSNDPLIPFDPSCARKLVEEAVDYARGLGLSPHPDYRKARLILADIDAGKCSQHFAFGQDGKPFFISGPKDTPEKCRRVINTLENTCGPDGYHYVVPVDSSSGITDGVLVLPPGGADDF